MELRVFHKEKTSDDSLRAFALTSDAEVNDDGIESPDSRIIAANAAGSL